MKPTIHPWDFLHLEDALIAVASSTEDVRRLTVWSSSTAFLAHNTVTGCRRRLPKPRQRSAPRAVGAARRAL